MSIQIDRVMFGKGVTKGPVKCVFVDNVCIISTVNGNENFVRLSGYIDEFVAQGGYTFKFRERHIWQNGVWTIQGAGTTVKFFHPDEQVLEQLALQINLC